MIRTLTIAALAAASLTGTAQAGPRAHRPAPADAAFLASYDRPAYRAAPQAARPAAPAPRSDFGSFSAANTARNLGF